jgi:hypothetical protein
MAYPPTSRSRALDDEVNLIELWLNFVKVLKSHFKLALLLIIVGAVLGFILYHRTAPVYKARMIANSTALNNAEVVAVIENWQELLGKGERKSLATKMGTPESVVAKLRGIEVEGNAGGVDGFVIDVLVSDYKVLDSLQKAIASGIENNPYVKERVALRLNTLKSLRKEVDQQIESLEKKRLSIDGLVTGTDNQNTGRMIADPSSINVQIILLQEKRFDLEEKIALIDDLQIIEGFTPSDVPESPKLLKNVVTGMILGFFIAILVITIILLNNRISTYQANLDK